MTKLEIAQTIIDAFEQSSANMDFQVAAYVGLMKAIQKDNAISPFTRCAYESFYGMAQARLTLEWKNRYFMVLNELLKSKVDESYTFEMLMNKVGPCNRKNRNLNEPSFTSKMLHTINEDAPIYDLHVRKFLKAGEPKSTGNMDLKTSVIDIYENKIRAFYDKKKHEDLRYLMKDAFDCWYEKKSRDINSAIGNYAKKGKKYNISDTKKVDFVMWTLGQQGKTISEFEQANSD